MTASTLTAVVVPIDFSEDSVVAIQTGLERVANPAALHVVHVLAPLDMSASTLQREYLSGHPREEIVQTRMKEIIKEAGAEGAQAIILEGDPGLETASYADKIRAQLIVVPSHGFHGVKRLLLGSTAERIIRHAHCSVLVLRRQDAD